ncbi:transposase [Marinifilum fragile]|uniref:transposase n=1 Tax=Marinifilum fragile TaxID=570161 RepID=UPI0006CFFE2E|nr:transposase [Marinifilum fragile]
MSAKFQDKYRIDSTRLQNWDYGSNGKYFIPICTCENEHFFGKITEEKMHLNAIGELADNYWHEIPNHFPYVHLDEFIVMPNHIHGILVIDDPYNVCNKKNHDRDSINAVCTENDQTNDKGLYAKGIGRDGIHAVCSKDNKFNPFSTDKNPMRSNNISKIIRWYKGRVTFDAHKINPKFEWHSRFYDHIIKDQKELQRIRNYIEFNPKNWKDDKYFE